MIARTLALVNPGWIFLGAFAFAISMPALAGPPFVTDDPEPPEYGRWEVNYAVMGTVVKGGGSGTVPSIDANYGLLSDVQLHIQPQLAYVRTPQGSQVGVGNTEIGVKYRFIEEDEQGWAPMVSFYPLFETPTGDRKRGLGEGADRTFLPIWAQKTIDQWTIYGGGGYDIDPGAQGQNAWFVGSVALYQVSDALQLGGEIFLQTAETTSDKDAPGFNLGGTYRLTEDLGLLFSAGRGLANPSSTNRLSAFLALQVVY